jgi:putative aminopeptidase FrvX
VFCRGGSPRVLPQPRWITALVALLHTDIFFSRSWDGRLGVWKMFEDLQKFELLEYVKLGVQGVVNGILVQEVGMRGADGVKLCWELGLKCD